MLLLAAPNPQDLRVKKLQHLVEVWASKVIKKGHVRSMRPVVESSARRKDHIQNVCTLRSGWAQKEQTYVQCQ